MLLESFVTNTNLYKCLKLCFYNKFYNQNGYIGIYNQCDRREKLRRFSEKRKYFRRKKKMTYGDHGDNSKRVDDVKKDKRFKNALISLQQNKRRKQLNNIISQAGVQTDSMPFQYSGFHGNKFYSNIQDSKISNPQLNTNQGFSHDINKTYAMNKHTQNTNQNNTMKSVLDRTSMKPLTESTPSYNNNFITQQLPKDSRYQIQHSMQAIEKNKFITNQYTTNKFNTSLIGNNRILKDSSSKIQSNLPLSSNITFSSTLTSMPNTTNTNTKNIKVSTSLSNVPASNLTKSKLVSPAPSYNPKLTKQVSNFQSHRCNATGSMVKRMSNNMPPTNHDGSFNLKLPMEPTFPNANVSAMLPNTKMNHHANDSKSSNLSTLSFNDSLPSTTKPPILNKVNNFSNHDNLSTAKIKLAPTATNNLPLKSNEISATSNILSNFESLNKNKKYMSSHFYSKSNQMHSTSKPLMVKTENRKFNHPNGPINHNDHNGNAIKAHSLSKNSKTNVYTSTKLQTRPVFHFETKNNIVQNKSFTSKVSSQYKAREMINTSSKPHANNVCGGRIFHQDVLNKPRASKLSATQLSQNPSKNINVNKSDQKLNVVSSHIPMKPFIPERSHLGNTTISTPTLASNPTYHSSRHDITSPISNNSSKYESSMKAGSRSNTMNKNSLTINPTKRVQSNSLLSPVSRNTLMPLNAANGTDNVNNTINLNPINKNTLTTNRSYSSSTFSLADATKGKKSTDSKTKLSKIDSVPINNNQKLVAAHSNSNPQYANTNRGSHDGIFGTSSALTKKGTNEMAYCVNPPSELNASDENVALAMALAQMPSRANSTMKLSATTKTKNQKEYHSLKAIERFAHMDTKRNEKLMKNETQSAANLPAPIKNTAISTENAFKPFVTKNNEVMNSKKMCNMSDAFIIASSHANSKVPTAFESSAPLVNTQSNNVET